METFLKIKKHGFIFALITAVGVAYLYPTGSAEFHIDSVTTLGIGMIFFFYGLKLSPKNFTQGVSNVKLHVLVQLSTFLVFPLLVLPFRGLFASESGHLMWVGVFFLAALPSTVSSSVVMVALAKGNVPAAIFNATLSGLLGVVITPLWLGLVVDSVGGVPFSTVVTKLLFQIILPIAIGVLLNRKMGDFATRNSKKISLFDKSIIVLIVYSSFSKSFLASIFSSVGVSSFIVLYSVILLLFVVMMSFTNGVSKALKFSVEDRITAMFSGSKKSLIHGSVMLKIVFGKSPQASIILLPILLYHISQLFIVAIIAERFSRRIDL